MSHQFTKPKPEKYCPECCLNKCSVNAKKCKDCRQKVLYKKTCRYVTWSEEDGTVHNTCDKKKECPCDHSAESLFKTLKARPCFNVETCFKLEVYDSGLCRECRNKKMDEENKTIPCIRKYRVYGQTDEIKVKSCERLQCAYSHSPESLNDAKAKLDHGYHEQDVFYPCLTMAEDGNCKTYILRKQYCVQCWRYKK